MPLYTDVNQFNYYKSLEEIKEDGLTPIPIKTPLQFFTLRGRTTKLAKENLVSIICDYVILAKEAEKSLYYLRKSREWSVDQMYFMRRTLDFSGEDVSTETLHRYIFDDRAWLLYTSDMIEETRKMLDRVRRAYINTGVLSYTTFYYLLECALKLEDYLDYGKGLIGFRTCVRIQEENMKNVWLEVSKK